MSTGRDDPPSNWAHATPAGSDIYWTAADAGPADAAPGSVESLLIWHWCTRQPPNPDDVGDGRWAAAGCAKHTLVSLDPLHLEPSLLWSCCGRHGYIRNGAWEPA